MSKVIIDYGGTIDKYIGDAVMAFWGAPLDDALHAFHACQTALEMMVALEHLNGSLLERSKPAISVRIGINTGFAVVGNVGSNDRLSYTAMGDSVNVGSRLQDINKIYKSEILVSAGTYELVKHFFHFRLLDHVAVRGKKEGIYVYQMLLPRDPLIDGLDVYNAEFKQAFDCYQRGEWDASINLFQKMIMSYPNDGLIRLFLERCICFKNNPPAGWQGIWRLD
jgi:adenylate cyclase